MGKPYRPETNQEVLKRESDAGFHPEIPRPPRVGFGVWACRPFHFLGLGFYYSGAGL